MIKAWHSQDYFRNKRGDASATFCTSSKFKASKKYSNHRWPNFGSTSDTVFNKNILPKSKLSQTFPNFI